MQADEAMSDANRVPRPGVRHRVLVVDDDPDLREAIADALRFEGHRVTEAANGREALEMVRRQRPSVIVTDLVMPVMSGWELVGALAADPSLRAIPVIVVSASPRFPGGACACLAKPFRLESLLATIEAAVRRPPAA
jgi:CheY-like chemotaxis protein